MVLPREQDRDPNENDTPDPDEGGSDEADKDAGPLRRRSVEAQCAALTKQQVEERTPGVERGENQGGQGRDEPDGQDFSQRLHQSLLETPLRPNTKDTWGKGPGEG